jgi:nitrate/nitrite-specific signal transduction histidine kinase
MNEVLQRAIEIRNEAWRLRMKTERLLADFELISKQLNNQNQKNGSRTVYEFR